MGHVFSSQYPPTSLPFLYPCWVWDTRTHNNWDNEVTSWTEVLSSCWTIIPISTSFPLGWLNFKAGWIFPVPEENLTRVWLWGSDFLSLVLDSVKHKLCCSGPESRAGGNVWGVQALDSKSCLWSQASSVTLISFLVICSIEVCTDQPGSWHCAFQGELEFSFFFNALNNIQ